MKKTTLAALLIVLCGGLAACGPKPEPEAPMDAVEAAPAYEPAPEPMAEPTPAMPEDGMQGHDGMQGEEGDEIAPHAGGDKVTPTPEQQTSAEGG